MTTASGYTSAICASKVIDTNVKDSSGRTIGEVEGFGSLRGDC